MGKHRGEIDDSGAGLNARRLDGGNLEFAQGFSYDLKPAGERRITEAPFRLAPSIQANGGGKRFFRVDQLGLRLGQRTGKRSKGFTGPRHGRPPCRSEEHTSEL